MNPAQSVFALVGVVFLGILAMPSGLPIDDAIASDDPLAAAIEKFDQGDNASAARLFESRLRSVPSDPRAHYFLGRLAYRDGELDNAATYFLEAIELAPGESDYHHWLGEAYISKVREVSMFKMMGFTRKARTAWLKAVELDPDNLAPRASLFFYYMEAPGIAGGSEAKALEQIKQISARDPRAGHFTMGSYYSDKEKYDDAEKEYQAVLALDPEDIGALRRLGRITQVREEWDAAFKIYEQILAADPDDLGSLYAIGRTAAISGKNAARGIACLERYLAAGPVGGLPARTHAHWRLGLIYQKQGNKPKARREFEAALAADPTNKEAEKALQDLS